MTVTQPDTERLARAIIDMAEKDKGLVLSKLQDMIERHVYCPPFSNPDGTMSDAYKAFRNQPPAQPEESLEAIFESEDFLGHVLKLAKGQLAPYGIRNVHVEIVDHGGALGIAAELNGKRHAVRRKDLKRSPHEGFKVPDETIKDAARQLAIDLTGQCRGK